MPLDFLLGIMRDENQDAQSRLDAAKAAAPYCHARLSSTEVSGPGLGPRRPVGEVRLGRTLLPAAA